jgi:hypothetical protein
MIETDKVDLQGDWKIKVVDCDCALEFPGYSVETVQGVDDSFHLVKITSHT